MECDITGGHVRSFSYVAEEGLEAAVGALLRERWEVNGDRVEVWMEGATLDKPVQPSESRSESLSQTPLLPSHCRQRGLTYKGQLKTRFRASVNGRDVPGVEKVLGEVPVMLRSSRCHLAGLSEEELVRLGEEPLEWGGYYIVNGSEKVIRYLVLMRRNFPVAMHKERFRSRGALFSEFALTMRCVRGNHTAQVLSLHYLETGGQVVLLKWGREMFYVPLLLILKALGDASDHELYQDLMRGREEDSFWKACVLGMLEAAAEAGALTQEMALDLLGSSFRVVLGDAVAPWDSDADVADLLLREALAIHLDTPSAKRNFLIFCSQKLCALVRGDVLPENPDNPQFQESSMSGHLVLALAKERLQACLAKLRKLISIHASKRGQDYSVNYQTFAKAVAVLPQSEFSRPIEYFLATGNLVSKTGLGLMQNSGFTVIAERINQLRFYSHFRAIHRGAFFMTMRTTDVRKLRPEAWGFICPVHTPDGAPCGLLNHLTAACEVVTRDGDEGPVMAVLEETGLLPLAQLALFPPVSATRDYPVLLNGRFLGYLSAEGAARAETRLRAAKVKGRVDRDLEVGFVRRPSVKGAKGQFPGLFLFSGAGRLMRPVRNMLADGRERIGTFEQVYLSICVRPEKELEWGVTLHQELQPNSFLSLAANLIPYPDHNQSPRNVYQCQMGKQTMGFPIYSWQHRADHKMYRIQTPQSPMVKPEAYDKYEMDRYPLGTNAIVAVISYSGYDMEDAMVISKASYQRGLAHGAVHKVERLWLSDPRSRSRNLAESFRRDPAKAELAEFLDPNGLPHVGRMYEEGEPYHCIHNSETKAYAVKKRKGAEGGLVMDVRLVEEPGVPGPTHALIHWRIQRNPIIGDKFASRHGQKGINSFLWPAEDMPFSETGMAPDILFNPHGYPSRMTIGMMIETMGGKAAALHGLELDATPFVFGEEDTGIDYMGRLLASAGYNYHGLETLYSGIDGREFNAHIFIGVVYYQRLRHMISDKFQVRSTGPSDPLTHQPIKGRQRGGGVRFGEMERDGLISHGTAALLRDRLLLSSDRDSAAVCGGCGSLLALQPQAGGDSVCRLCRTPAPLPVTIPYVFRYLVAELAAVNLKATLRIAPAS